MTFWLFLLMLTSSLANYRPSESEICKLDIIKLQRQILNLQNYLLLGEWKLKVLRENNYLWVKSRIFSFNKNMTKATKLPSTSGNLIVYDEDCTAVYNSRKTTSGYYRIKPKSIAEPFLVYCDMSDGGGWTVIQRRSSGKVNFNRRWREYKTGFGLFETKDDEYWLGNDRIHALATNGNCLLKIELQDWNGESRYAFYDDFQVKDQKDHYRVWFGAYSGNAGDAFSGGTNVVAQWSASHSGMKFSTPDKDNDRYHQGSCAKESSCGWWFNRCHAANLNGKYYVGGNYTGKHDNGVIWSTWHGYWYSLKYTAMKIRPLSFMDMIGSGDGAN
ncbi:fibrinogen-like protein 1 [Protopterus annectens]|uniref:fibrinogen-like protein 1 n=1 Tax=Protopterus annectens TaxID=7888 RepID=UPI001CFC40D2|nr:fibrinogen-like protein 1 [Protopterus annectens]